MDVVAKTSFLSTVHGQVEKGYVLEDVSEALAEQWISLGMVDRVPVNNRTYETKVERPEPVLKNVPLESGQDSDASLSQAAQASPKKTRKSSRKKTPSRSTRQSD